MVKLKPSSSFTYRMENHQNHDPDQDPDLQDTHHQLWGTWEELLLACAVNRHGFKDWDTVAMEVQSRTTLPNLQATARHCEQKFHDLNRRFADQCNDAVQPNFQNGTAAGENSDHVPWLDELRKLRVAELRREVQRYDVSILSLQLKVKRLEEEREKESDGKLDKKPDLAVSGEPLPENERTGGEREVPEPTGSEPETRRLDESTTNTDKLLPTTGDESDRENQSVNESNSTGSRFDGEKTGDGEGKVGLEAVPVRSGPKEPDPIGRKGKPVGEESNNGSYDTVVKVPTCESQPPSEERKAEGDSSELRGDSVGHSGEGGGTRESSEVQSSASLTRKRKTRRRKEVSGGGEGGSGGDEVLPENDEGMVKSEPLISVLEMIKGHEHSSLFERRLESQESDRYKNIVRQHVDLETIQLRLQKGSYSSCTSQFFRDLLLLFTNAIVFFPKDSVESTAAHQLRRLVLAEMKSHGQAQSDPTPQKADSLPPNAPQTKPDSLLSKHKASAPIVVCRKRSSISAKPSSATTFGQKGDQPIINDKEKPSSDTKPPSKPSSSDEDEDEDEPEPEPEPPKAKEKPVTGARSLRRSNKNLSSNNSSNKKLPTNSSQKAGSSATKPAESAKPEKSKAEGGQDKKRNAAADFLKRIKRNAPADALKSGSSSGGGSSSSRGGGGGSGASAKEQKKTANSGKGDKGKERASRLNPSSGSGDNKRNKNNESSSQSKRSVGRPPKKTAESNAVSAKRGRESSAGKDKRPKKRAKK